MNETELKFQVPAAHRTAVDMAVAGRARPARTRLQAAYHDTAQRALANAGLALRLRKEGRQWVQTLKGGTGDAMTRLEHNVPRGAAAAMPEIDPALHAETAAGAALAAALAAGPRSDPLSVRFRTDILRRSRALRSASGRVELAFDSGRIEAEGAALEVCELEIELLAGRPQAVLDTARRWLPRFGLWLDTRSKAERGDLLARGEPMALPRSAAPVSMAPEMSPTDALHAVLASCAEQITANASQIAAGEHSSEHVHQLRVGLRRLRSALKLFETGTSGAALGGAAATLFRRLGSARDRVVVEEVFAADLAGAMRSAGLELGSAAAPPPAAEPPPTALLRETTNQRLLLDLLEATHVAQAVVEPGTALRAHLAQRLNRWHRLVVADARRFGELDDAQRHRLRKRAKRLRYGVEFAAALFKRRAVRRYLRALRDLQDRLGAITDTMMALDVYKLDRDSDPCALFAIGWLTARQGAQIAQAAPALKAFGKVERFWKPG